MGAAVWTYKAVDGTGIPSKGELKGTQDAVKEQLAAAIRRPPGEPRSEAAR
jgi:hypothetical protein